MEGASFERVKVGSPTRFVVGRLYPGIGVLFSIDSLSFPLANSALPWGPLSFLRFLTRPAFDCWVAGSIGNPRRCTVGDLTGSQPLLRRRKYTMASAALKLGPDGD